MQSQPPYVATLACCLMFVCVFVVAPADLKPGQQYYYQVLGTSDSSSSSKDAVREKSPKISKLFNFTVRSFNI
jgi:hypothetical protein